MINGSPSDNNASQFKQGAHKIFDPLVAVGKLTIANEYDKLLSVIGAKGTNAFTSFDYTGYLFNFPTAFWEHGLHAWDVAAGSIIIKQAGGKVSDFKGGDKFLFNGELVASNEVYYNEFFSIVNNYFAV